MIVARAHDLIYQIPLVRHKDQSLRLFIQTANRVNTLRIRKHFHNIFCPVFVRSGADDPSWFIYRKQNRAGRFYFSPPAVCITYRLSIAYYFLSIFYTLTHLGSFSVN